MSRRTAFKGSAAGRRRERRSHLQNPETLTADVLHRPTPGRALIQAKGVHHTPDSIDNAVPIKFIAQDAIWQREEYKRQIERAAIIYQQEFGHKYIESADYLCHRAIYALGLQKRKKITAR